MMRKVVLYSVFGTFLFAISACAVLFTPKTSARTNSCVALVNVTLYNRDVEIKGATATAYNKETKKSYQAVLEDGMPMFENLPEGDYRVSITKSGYMRSVDDFSLDCSDNFTLWNIELYKGNSKLTVKLYNREPTKIVRDLNNTVIGSNDSNTDRDLRSDVQSDGVASDNDSPIKSTPTPKPVPKMVVGGVVNGKAQKLVTPSYPQKAREQRTTGSVQVRVTIDEAGNIISAKAISGPEVFWEVCEQAARESKFNPTMLSGQPVKVTGIIVYNFVP